MYLQCALLYTTADGARRVRVSTLALPVSDQMGAVFKGADLDSQLAALSRQVRHAAACGQCCRAGQEGGPASTSHTDCLLQWCVCGAEPAWEPGLLAMPAMLLP